MHDIRSEILIYCIKNSTEIREKMVEGDHEKVMLDTAVEVLEQVKHVVNNAYLNDRDAMERIVEVFEHYGIGCGIRKRTSTMIIHRE